VWSWTVWLTGSDVDFENPKNQRYYNGYTFMDRNLGGGNGNGKLLYYQWGRKDPVAYHMASPYHPVAITPAPANMDAKEMAKHLGTFFTATAAQSYDWMTAGQHNNLWSTIDGEKGLYDPCPFGWRVPPAENNAASPWDGYTYSTYANYLPVENHGGFSGFNGADGKPSMTFECPVWGASARGIDAYLFDANPGAHRQAHRSDAYPVRCIRDAKRTGSVLIVKTPLE
jgi:hypothetical protein